jgi:aliphatic sulfonates family ABC transporter substrate-binding protein
MTTTTRATFLSTVGGAVALTALPARADRPATLTIGYQKDGVLLVVMQQGVLEQKLAAAGVKLTFVEFQSGPPLLEALNAGSIDIGQTGDTPPIFAQAAGAKLVYLAAAPDAGKRSGIVVHADGGIAKVADLKGKRVAFTRGSSAHNFVVHALTQAGLTPADITAVNVQPADAAAAFRSGSVDAWGIWDPFFALAERIPNTRTLVTADKVFPTNRFFLAGSDFVAQRPDLATAFVNDLDRASRWATTHQPELAQLFATQTGVDLDVEKIVAARDVYGVRYLDDGVIKQQQAIADTFAQLALIPHAVDVRAIAYVPSAKARAALAHGGAS